MIKQGDKIRFKGGTGRKDDDVIHNGVVNGEPIRVDNIATHVPVYLSATDQNVLVALRNIVEDEEGT